MRHKLNSECIQKANRTRKIHLIFDNLTFIAMTTLAGDKAALRRPDVFISYSRKDRDFVRRLSETLQARGREAWVDWEGIRPAEEFMQAIFPAIERTDTFVFVISPDSVGSEVCGRELAHAATHNKRMVPIIARDVDAKAVPEPLAKLNWIFCRESDSFDQATDTLISALDTDLAWVRAHTRLLTRAVEWEAKGKNNSFVLRGDDLRAAEQWLTQAGADKERQPTALQTEYIIASRKAETRRQRTIRTWVSIAAVISLGLAVIALFARKEAVKQRDIAVTQQKMSASRELAATSQTQLQIDPELSVLLGMEAARRWPTAEAESALRQAVLKSHLHRTLGTATENVRGAVFSPGGERLITWGNEKGARLWNPATGEQIAELEKESRFRSPAFGLDGKSFLLVSSSGAVRLCEAVSGKTIQESRDPKAPIESAAFAGDGVLVASISGSVVRVSQLKSGSPISELRGHQGKISFAELSPDGATVFTQGKDKTARLWETATGRNISSWSLEDKGYGGAFSPDGKRLVHGLPDYSAVVRDATTGEVLCELRGHQGGIKHYAFSRDSKLVVTSCFDGAARVFDAASGKLLSEVRGARGLVGYASFSPDGKFIVSCDPDNAARVWQLATGDPIAMLRTPDNFNSAVFSPDGKFIVSGGGRGARMWRVPRPPELRGHTDIVWSVAWSPDSKSLVTAGGDNTPRVWDAASAQQRSALQGHTDAVWMASFSPDGKRILTASVDRTARLWNAETGKSLLVLTGHAGDVHEAAFSPDARLVVTASKDKTARVWDAVTGASLHELKGHAGDLLRIAFSPDGKLIATASFDSTARLWDTVTGKPVAELKGHTKSLTAVAFSPDGKLLVTASEDDTARIWDVASARTTAVIGGHKSGAISAVFSPDGQRVLTGSHYSDPRLFDLQGKELIAFRGHSNELTGATFSQDGRFVLSSADDQKAIVWNPETGDQVMELRGFQRGVSKAAFSPNGRMIAAAGWDLADKRPIYGSVQIVSADACYTLEESVALASRRVTRPLTSVERALYLHEAAGQSAPARLVETPVPSATPAPAPAPKPEPSTPAPTIKPATPPPPAPSAPAPPPRQAVPDRFTNSLGMNFVPVGEVLVCVWETRVKDFSAFATASGDRPGTQPNWSTPGFTQAENHPVVCVSWNDAQAFCAWLTEKERAEKLIKAPQRYRLPSTKEWSQFVGTATYPWGEEWPPKKAMGNYAGKERDSQSPLAEDNFKYTAPVGSFPPNQPGIFDLGGNVWEWCNDSDSAEKTARVLRGGSWTTGDPAKIRSAFRLNGKPEERDNNNGFRVVLTGIE